MPLGVERGCRSSKHFNVIEKNDVDAMSKNCSCFVSMGKKVNLLVGEVHLARLFCRKVNCL